MFVPDNLHSYIRQSDSEPNPIPSMPTQHGLSLCAGLYPDIFAKFMRMIRGPPSGRLPVGRAPDVRRRPPFTRSPAKQAPSDSLDSCYRRRFVM